MANQDDCRRCFRFNFAPKDHSVVQMEFYVEGRSNDWKRQKQWQWATA